AAQRGACAAARARAEGDVALEPEDEILNLPVVAGLQAADEFGAVGADRSVEPGNRRTRIVGDRAPRAGEADVAADIEAGPGEWRHHGRRGFVPGPCAEVGSLRHSARQCGYGAERNAGQELLLHQSPLTPNQGYFAQLCCSCPAQVPDFPLVSPSAIWSWFLGNGVGKPLPCLA